MNKKNLILYTRQIHECVLNTTTTTKKINFKFLKESKKNKINFFQKKKDKSN
jgi:hypothetical protein